MLYNKDANKSFKIRKFLSQTMISDEKITFGIIHYFLE